MDDQKKPWESKTLWVAALTALAPLYPPVGIFVAANPEMVSAGIGVLFGLLRFVSSKKVGVK